MKRPVLAALLVGIFVTLATGDSLGVVFACSIVEPIVNPEHEPGSPVGEHREIPADCYGRIEATTPRDMLGDVLPALAAAEIGMAILSRAVRWSLNG